MESRPLTPDELRWKLQEVLQYVEAAPTEMRRHQQMAHDVCRQGEGLVSLVFSADVSRLRGKVCAAQAHYVSVAQKLHDRGFDDPDFWGIADVFSDMRSGGKALAEALGHVRSLEDQLGRHVGELRAELAALRASSEALVCRENVDAAEDFAARARRRAMLIAYGDWGK